MNIISLSIISVVTTAFGQSKGAYLDSSCPYASGEFEYGLELMLNVYPNETSWLLVDDSTGLNVSWSANFIVENQTITDDLCLPEGCFTFTIADAYGDGICCEEGEGYYVGYIHGDEEIFSGGDFNETSVHNFCAVDTCNESTSTPTVSPTLFPTIQSGSSPPNQSPTTSTPTVSPTLSPTIQSGSSPPNQSPTTSSPTESSSPLSIQPSSSLPTMSSTSSFESQVIELVLQFFQFLLEFLQLILDSV